MTAGPAERAPARKPNETPARRRRISTLHGVLAVIGVVLVGGFVIAIRYHSGSDRRRYDAMLRATLDKIVTAQEGYYYDSMRYAGSLPALPTVQLPAGVHVQLINPDRRSWWGVAIHDRVPGHRCVVWVGTAPTTLPVEARVPENETKPLCFDDTGTGARATRPS